MALNFKQIENTLIEKQDESSLAAILTEYATIKQKVENSDDQSWYFKQGMESSMKRLTALKEDFEEIRQLFNQADLDFFIEKINENTSVVSGYKGKHIGSLQSMHISYINGLSKFYGELIRLKSKTSFLMPVDYYLVNPEEFEMFFE